MKYNKINYPLENTRLYLLINKFLRTSKSRNIFRKLMKKNYYDDKIYKIIGKLIKKERATLMKKLKMRGGDINPISTKICNRNTSRVQFINYRFLSELTETDKNKIKNYLDIGCGDGKLSEYIGKALGLSKENINCVDLEKWYDYDKIKRRKSYINMKYIKEGGDLPYNNNSMDLISTIMMLHHTKDLDKMLREINRVLKKGNYYIIIEHDAVTKFDYMLIDIEHAIYEVAINNDNSFFNTYYGKYFDWIELNEMMNKFGFSHIKSSYIGSPINFNLSPTRAYLTIYKKTKDIFPSK
jgi:ubiquinone/menaquinone biosynthesis C-methylase UbiE